MYQANAYEPEFTYTDKSPKKVYVEKMFDEIAHSYDALNHILSLGIDRIWRKSAIKFLRERSNPDSILDVATGTADFAIIAHNMLSPRSVTGIDISEKMLELGKNKINENGLSEFIELRKEDCSNMSFPDNHFDAIISSFGLRNFENLDNCLKEMYRVLKPNGNIVVIDLCTPRNFPMKQLFWCYKKMIMPLVGKTISHNDHAYKYLPHTMDVIPQGEEMVQYFSSAGFKNVHHKPLITQMCVLYSATK